MTSSRETGEAGERIAEQYLIKKGYRIVERNFRRPFGEIDIVARLKTALICVEVKTSTGSVEPGWQMTEHKLIKFKRIIEAYLFENSLHATEVRADAILITLNQATGEHALEHIEGVELP